MSSNTEKSKRIAKNTLYLYLRMFLSMVVSFYTSRVVLEVLGVEDYGIYNIVGGLVVLFTFLNATLIGSMQRFLNLAVGRGDIEEQQRIFAATFRLFIFCAIGLFILMETVGLWFLNNELNIPPTKYTQANVVFQISVATTVISLMRIPYNAYILSQEKMSFYAYVSIVETVLKLLVVFLLVKLPFDKLNMYAFLYMLVAIFINAVYVWYCRRKFPMIHFTFSADRKTLREISKFSGWMVLTGVADMGYMQGTNIIVNMFCGVLYNATMGITNQLKNVVFSFVRNLMVAAQPQIMKSYASGDRAYFRTLMVSVSKASFYLFFVLAIPLIFNMVFILEIWLKNYPPDTDIFCILCMIFCMVDSLICPLWTAAQISTDIKRYQIITGSIILLNLPLAILFLYLGFPPYCVFVIQIAVNLVSVIYRIGYLDRKRMFSALDYIRNVVIPILGVVAVTVPPLYVVTLFSDGLERLVITLPMSFILICCAVLTIGLNRSERSKVIAMILKRLKLSKA